MTDGQKLKKLDVIASELYLLLEERDETIDNLEKQIALLQNKLLVKDLDYKKFNFTNGIKSRKTDRQNTKTMIENRYQTNKNMN